MHIKLIKPIAPPAVDGPSAQSRLFDSNVDFDPFIKLRISLLDQNALKKLSKLFFKCAIDQCFEFFLPHLSAPFLSESLYGSVFAAQYGGIKASQSVTDRSIKTDEKQSGRHEAGKVDCKVFAKLAN